MAARLFFTDIWSLYMDSRKICRVFRGKVIFLDDNLARLANSIKKSGIELDLSALRVGEKLDHLIQLEHIKEGNIIGHSVYEVEQQGLTENLLNVGDFFKRQGKWVTAEELAREAMIKAVKDLNL